MTGDDGDMTGDEVCPVCGGTFTIARVKDHLVDPIHRAQIRDIADAVWPDVPMINHGLDTATPYLGPRSPGGGEPKTRRRPRPPRPAPVVTVIVGPPGPGDDTIATRMAGESALYGPWLGGAGSGPPVSRRPPRLPPRLPAPAVVPAVPDASPAPLPPRPANPRRRGATPPSIRAVVGSVGLYVWLALCAAFLVLLVWSVLSAFGGLLDALDPEPTPRGCQITTDQRGFTSGC